MRDSDSVFPPPECLGINAQAGGHHSWNQKLSIPSLTSVLNSISSVGIYRYNFETIELLREKAAQWSALVAKSGETMNAYLAVASDRGAA